MRKILLLVVITGLITGIPACKKDELNGKCPDQVPYFDINSMGVTALNTKPENTFNILLENDTVEEKEFHISCYFEYVYHAQTTPTPPLFSTPSAYALSCIPKGIKGSEEGIDTIYIISKNPLASWFDKNDTINDVVRINKGSLKKPVLQPVGQYIADNKEVIEYNTVGIDENRMGGVGFDIMLYDLVQNKTQPHTFTVIVKLNNGEQYTATTPAVYFR